jgi:hypothetical protein
LNHVDESGILTVASTEAIQEPTDKFIFLDGQGMMIRPGTKLHKCKVLLRELLLIWSGM